MKIIEFKAENIKNLKVIEIKPDGTAVILTGKNGAGKSNVLNAICTALAGKKIEDPIRDGEKKAQVTIKIGDFEVKKIFTPSGERLEVMTKEGAKYPSPQAFLNKILGDLTFDPLAFSKMKEVEQRQLLINLVKLDLSALDKKKADAYSDRTIKIREVNSLKAIVNSLSQPRERLPKEETLLSEELAKIKALEDKAQAYKDFEKEIKDINTVIATNNEDIEESLREIAELKERISVLELENSIKEKENIKLEEDLKSKIAPENVPQEKIDEAEANLSLIESTNNEIRAAKKYREENAKLSAAEGEVEFLTARISEIEDEKIEKIKSCKFPVPGLSINDECVLFEDKPLARYSTGQLIKLSTAIAMALNPTLRIILIREGSDLDSDGLKSIIDVAKDKDYQLWIEKVADSKGVGIFIENGEIKNG